MSVKDMVMEGLERCRLHDGSVCKNCNYSHTECVEGLCADAIKLIEQQQAEIERLKEQQPKWIPINERKPNSCGVYVVARWFIDGCRRKILTDACYFDGSNTWNDDTRVNHSRPYLTDKIVAWMPLPNPPKDGEQE